MDPKIIHQDESILVLDKPSGWITNEAGTTTNQPVVQKWLRDNFQFSVFSVPEYRNGIVHRLDKETSGLLLIAKTSEAFEDLQKQFKIREVQKTYVALVHGNLKPSEGLIKTELGRLPWRRDRFGVLPGGRESVTRYKVVHFYELQKAKPHLKSYSLVEFYPKTGRTHQIRIHSKFVGHPIVGDEFYAGRKTSRDDRKWCPRLFLHSKKIVFFHPVSKTKIEFESELPINLKKPLDTLTLLDI